MIQSNSTANTINKIMPTCVYIVREYNGFPLMVFLIRKNAEEYAAKYHKETGRRCEIDRAKIDDFEEFSR